jgi:hypothetical protein
MILIIVLEPVFDQLDARSSGRTEEREINNIKTRPRYISLMFWESISVLHSLYSIF